jgi:hypothetical protein
MGGTRGGLIGATLGGVNGQIRGPQTGGTSIAELHIACTSPLTHIHRQWADKSDAAAIPTMQKMRRRYFIRDPLARDMYSETSNSRAVGMSNQPDAVRQSVVKK